MSRLPRGCGVVFGMLLGLVLLVWLGREGYIGQPSSGANAVAPAAMPSMPTDAVYGFQLLGVTRETLESFMTVFGTALLFFLMLGIVSFLASKVSVDRKTAMFVAAWLALIGLVGSGGRLAPFCLLLYGAGIGLIGTLLGGAACGTAVRHGAPLGLLMLALSGADLVAVVLAPSVAELQLLFAILAALGGASLYGDVSREIRRTAGADAILMAPPVVAIAVVGAIVAVPLVIPGWSIVQILVYSVAFAGGFLRS